MMSSPALFDDTIAAIATPRGTGALAVIRVSGGACASILGALAPALGGALPAARTQRLLRLVDPRSGHALDHALVSYFPAPNSYTGEDVLEIATHGGAVAPQLVLDALVGQGARLALRGEFTRRALLNGKLDLLQAEAVADLVSAGSPALHRSALFQIERGLSTRIEALRSSLLRAEALAGYGIDFPEEDEPPVPPDRVRNAIGAVGDRLRSLLASAPRGDLLREGVLVVLAGAPNTGKSSLFNALLGVERAIVTEVAGTTRDAVEAVTTIDGFPFRFVDTAGLRDSDDRVEALGIEVARRYLDQADLVLFCVEAGRAIAPDEERFLEGLATPRLVVRTRADEAGDGWNPVSDEEIVVSSREGEGLERLRREMLGRTFARGREEDDTELPLVTRRRHAEALRLALAEVQRCVDALDTGTPPEFATTHLRAAADHLAELVGVVSSDDVLTAIFSEFCVGK